MPRLTQAMPLLRRAMPLLQKTLSVISLCVVTAFASAQEARVELRSTVTGNQEQPKVLYIVPWQQAETIELGYQPLQSLTDDAFEEVERNEFLRELDYRRMLNESENEEP